MILVPLQYMVDPSSVISMTSELELLLEEDGQGKTDNEAPESIRNFCFLKKSCR